MTTQELDLKTKELIENSKRIAIVPSLLDGVDSFSASIGLYRVLIAKGKEATLLYPGTVPAGLEKIAEGVNVSSALGNRSLMVSIDYSGTSASKVNYTTENDVLFFYLTPVDRDFDLSKVKAEITGPNYDLYITIGIKSPEDTGALKEHLLPEISKSRVVNIDNSASNTHFGTIYHVDTSIPSLSLMVLNKVGKWDLYIDSAATKAFSSGINL